MHNSLKYFKAASQTELFGQMEQFMADEKVSGKSISMARDESNYLAILGYLPGNVDNWRYSIIAKEIGSEKLSPAELQHKIDQVTDEVGHFVCQAELSEHGNLSIAFLLGK